MMILATLITRVQAAQSVTLAWGPSTDPNVTGYNIYYGGSSRAYTNVVDAGKTTTAAVPGLVEGGTYYFSATAYNILGMESDFSNEASYTVPITLAKMQIRAGSAGKRILTVTGQAGHTYEIQATQTLTNWTAIGTVTLGAGGSLDFTDTNAPSLSRRFYRTRATP